MRRGGDQGMDSAVQARSQELCHGIDLIFIPSGSPHLNPIEKVRDYLKWTMCLIIVDDESEFKNLVQEMFDQITDS